MKVVMPNCNNIHIEFPWCDGTAYIHQNSGCLQLAWGECDESIDNYTHWLDPIEFRQPFLAGLGVIQADYKARTTVITPIEFPNSWQKQLLS
jgi:hypothetical protein